MKKFLSLLLALTLVLSLVVVPARANGDTYSPSKAPELEVKSGKTVIATTDAVAKDTNLTFKVKTDGISFTKNGSESVNDVTYSYEWSGAIVKDEEHGQATESVSANSTTSTTSMTVSCTVKAKSSGTTIYTFPAITRAVTVYDLNTAIDKVYFNDRPYDVTYSGSSGSATVYRGTDETLAGGKWQVVPKENYTAPKSEGQATNAQLNSSTLSFKVGYNDESVTPVDKTITITDGTLSTPTVTITTPSNSNNTVRTNQEVVFSAAVANKSSNTKYSWTITNTTTNVKVVDGAIRDTNTYSWTPTAEGTYSVSCKLYEGTVETNVSGSLNSVTVEKDNTVITKSYSSTMLPNGSQVLSFTFKDKQGNNYVDVAAADMGTVTWTTTLPASGTPAPERDSTDQKKAKFTLGASPAANYTVKATFTYKNKPYEVVYNISTQTLNAKLPSTYYGAGNSRYTSSDLVSYAREAVKSSYLTSGEYVSTVEISTTGANAHGLGLFSVSNSSLITFTPYVNSFGTATFTGTAVTNKSQRFAVTFSIPVTPVPVNSFDSQTAEPVSTTTTNTNYKVSAPYGYTKFYVLGNSNSLTASQTVDYSRYSASQLNSMGYTYTTIPSTYFSTSGQCTLYVIAWNDSTSYTSYSRYYCGPMTVTQTNYNINYNGVAGETVQFAQSDFTDFMNEVAEARGDASKTKSYPYVTFDYVTFSLPTTAQGTLYYGGTAMSTSNSSGAFNTRTKVTNLDSVTFVPNAKTTAKTITLNFMLHATCYSSSSTSRGTERTYYGTVVINLVREDIKYTVSQGDSVRFDESDFLSYLRSTKGYTSNYTIDYVTFDQSAVSAVNEGSLYTYYNGYNYGGSVKTTDKFYYSATASQNALSDVAFLASRYAKTGETVYIPFTIYARYGTTGTGTRQLTGTVAIKIGQTMNFIDVKTTDYFYNSVKWAVGKNITNGTSSTTFSPYKSCTRAEIVTFLWRAAGSPEPTITRNPFRDVNAVTHSSYYKAILWASQKGITSGTSATAFSPDQVCTRAQIVTFLYRYAGQPSGYYSNPFKDVGATSEASYYNAILWAVGKGITTGTSATTFSPYASCNRAEAVTFLYRYTNGL